MTQEKIPLFIDSATAPKLTPAPGVEMNILSGLHGEKMMMILNKTLPGHSGPTHSHPHEQICIVYSGKGLVRIGNEQKVLQQGDFCYTPGNVPHSDTCIGEEPFVMVEIFYPVRGDFVEKLKKVPKAERG